eukprot:CAMPEP_0119306838 /NCGR_PEP_ID=MMETSP1333-20130426/7503_1 /TAXON_ID=418940 /ORGANISM="Scyphosphaera apsteinii, Strain RCC1455" /LENGTH=37 /DNA_ID= /DNA_START= /DNA_END= /DNA_ORIENTATION=
MTLGVADQHTSEVEVFIESFPQLRLQQHLLAAVVEML